MRRLHFWLLLGTLVLGATLRFTRVGALSLVGNEDYLANAMRGLEEEAVPRFPSGEFYRRALPLTYLTGLSVKLFGQSNLSLRLPPTVFSILSILLVYLLASRLLGRGTGLVAAALMAVSDWEIVLGRTARMYGMLSTFVLLSTWLTLGACLDGRARTKALALVATAITGTLQLLAIMLVPIYALVFLYRRARGAEARFLVASAILIVASVGLTRKMEFRGLFDGIRLHPQTAAIESQPAEPAEQTGPAAPQSTFERLKQRILNAGPVEVLMREHITILVAAWRDYPGLSMAGGVLYLFLLLACGIAAVRQPGAALFPLALAAVGGALVLQLVLVALELALVYLLVGRRLEPAACRARAGGLLGLVAAGFLGWVGFATLVAGSHSLPAAAAATIRFPPNFFAFFAGPYPALSTCAVVALLVAIRRYLKAGTLDGIGLLAALCFVPLIALGFHPSIWSRVYARYPAFLNPFFLIAAAFGLAWLAQRWRERAPQAALRAIGIVLLGLMAARETAYPAVWVVQREHGENPPLPFSSSRAKFHSDHEGPARYVEAHRRPTDIVVAMDILAHHAYSPHAHYQLTRDPGFEAEAWIAARTIHSRSDIEKLLHRHCTARVWFVLEGKMVQRFEDDPEMGAILRLLEERAGKPRYVARDRISSVYLVPREIG